MPDVNVPEFSIQMPMRCYHLVGPSRLAVCGEIASWMRPAASSFDATYFCDRHHVAGDVPLPESYVFRRVNISAQLLIASAARSAIDAQVEAIAKLDQALAAAGAVPDWLRVWSTLGRFTARPPAGPARAFRRVG